MNHSLNELNFGDLYQELFTSVSYKNLAARYRSRLLNAVAGQNEPASANRDPDLIEAAATEVERLIPQALGIFRLITAAPAENSEGSDFNTTQLALHEYLLKTLYHINRNCRTLLEAQVNYDKHESIEAYLRTLKKLHGIADMPMLVVLQKSHEADETIFYGLVERECTLKIFDTGSDGVCFQIYNKQRDEVLQVLEEARTDNSLAISKRYFFFRIFQVFQHLFVCNQLCDLEKLGAAKEENLDEVEVGEYLMDAFNQAAADIL